MTVFVREIGVESDAGDVLVSRADEGLVKVTFPCGESRTLSYENAQTIITALNALRDHPDVWLTFKDEYGETFAAQIESGDLVVGDAPVTGSARVPWRDLRKGVRRIVGREAKVPEPEVSAA